MDVLLDIPLKTFNDKDKDAYILLSRQKTYRAYKAKVQHITHCSKAETRQKSESESDECKSSTLNIHISAFLS